MDWDDPQFKGRCLQAMRRVAASFAYVQGAGMVSLADPLDARGQNHEFDTLMAEQEGFAVNWPKKRGNSAPTVNELVSAARDDWELPELIVAQKLALCPGQPRRCQHNGSVAVNLWHKPQWGQPGAAQSKVAVGMFEGLVRHLCAGETIPGEPAGAVADHLLNWLAHLVQRPGDRVNHAVLITSAVKGVGKGTLAAVIERLVGERNCGVADPDQMKGGYDNWIAGKLVVTAHEIYEGGNYALAEKLKSKITEPRIRANLKYGPDQLLDNFARLLMFSNNETPLPMEDGERRYFVVRSKAERPETALSDRWYAEMLRDDGIEAIHAWLIARDISGWNAKKPAPLTESFHSMVAATANPLKDIVASMAESGKLGVAVTLDEVTEALRKVGYERHARNLPQLSEALTDAGYTPIRVRESNGSRPRKWRRKGAGAPAGAAVPDEDSDF
jgi:hypothetical protein